MKHAYIFFLLFYLGCQSSDKRNFEFTNLIAYQSPVTKYKWPMHHMNVKWSCYHSLVYQFDMSCWFWDIWDWIWVPLLFFTFYNAVCQQGRKHLRVKMMIPIGSPSWSYTSPSPLTDVTVTMYSLPGARFPMLTDDDVSSSSISPSVGLYSTR